MSIITLNLFLEFFQFNFPSQVENAAPEKKVRHEIFNHAINRKIEKIDSDVLEF